MLTLITNIKKEAAIVCLVLEKVHFFYFRAKL